MKVFRMLVSAVEVAEVVIGERVGNLDRTVGSEVVENDRIVVLDCRNRFAVFFRNDGRNRQSAQVRIQFL